MVIDIANTRSPSSWACRVRVFALDTGRLPEETYLTAERVIAKYGIPIEWQFPDRVAVERLLQAKGLYSFRDSLDNRHECCGIRKVEPLGRMLVTLDAWVTGLRREQSMTRTEAREVEHDPGYGGMAKLNPIIGWSTAEVRAYAEAHKVPIHPLHDQRLSVNRLRSVHARRRARRASARRPVVVGEPREQGVRSSRAVSGVAYAPSEQD